MKNSLFKKVFSNSVRQTIFSARGKAQAKMVLPPVLVMAMGFGMVFLSILYAVMQINSNEAFQTELYITQLGLDLQAIQALGKDINAERDIIDAGAYHLEFQGGQASIKQRGTATNIFFFTQTPGLVFTGGEYIPEKDKTIGPLKIFKMGKKFGITKPQNVPSPYSLNCESLPTIPLNKIALDPGKGYDEKTEEGTTGIQVFGTTESDYTRKLANKIRSGRTRYNPTRALDQESHASIETRQKTEGDAIISLHASTETKEAIKAYYKNEPESKKLACEILNEITEPYKIPVRPIPINFEHTMQDDPKNALRGNRPGVYIEIPSVSLFTNTDQLANAINKGVENYGIQ